MAILEKILSLGTIPGMGGGYEPGKDDHKKDDKDRKGDHKDDHDAYPRHKVVAKDDYFKGDEDSYITGYVLKNDTDSKDHTLYAKELKGPEHGTLVLNKDGSFKYTPDKDFYGYDSFKYKAYDKDGKYDWAEVKLEVKDVPEPAPNEAPVAKNDYFKVKEGKYLKGNVLANDTDADGDDLDAVLVSGPKKAKYFDFDEETGDFKYIAKHDKNKDNEKDYFTYKVKDEYGNYSKVAKVYIDIKDDDHKGYHHDHSKDYYMT
jgi:hypothetical protein